MSDARTRERHPREREWDRTTNGRADRIADQAMIKLVARISMILAIPFFGVSGYMLKSLVEQNEKRIAVIERGVLELSLRVERSEGAREVRIKVFEELLDRVARLEGRRSEAQ